MMTRNGSGPPPSTLLACDGLMIKDYSVPPFRIQAGHAVCLHVPIPSPVWQEELLPMLTGRIVHPAVRRFGSVDYLDRPMPRRRWWGGRHDLPVRDWLLAEKGLSSAEATSILDRLVLSPELPIGRIGWNERTMLALEACLLRPPDLLVCDTAGNDPLGRNRILERLRQRPPRMSLIYCKTRHQPDEPCLPGSECIVIGCRPMQTSVRE